LSFIAGNIRSEPPPKFSFTYINDSLILSYNPPETITDTIIFNNETKNYEKVKYYKSSTFYAITDMDPSCRSFSIKFSGFQSIPKFIIYNGKTLNNCPTKNLDFKIYNGDTINIIDRYGFQHGIWLEFYDSGQIMTKKIYKHGEFIEGFQYDRGGKIINKIFRKGTLISE
jgi:antitoxin component YwqK of YwqJK toxin-antitoxin module